MRSPLREDLDARGRQAPRPAVAVATQVLQHLLGDAAFGVQLLDVQLANHLGGRPAEHALGGAAEEDDAAAHVRRHHGVVRRVDEALEELLGLPQLVGQGALTRHVAQRENRHALAQLSAQWRGGDLERQAPARQSAGVDVDPRANLTLAHAGEHVEQHLLVGRVRERVDVSTEGLRRAAVEQGQAGRIQRHHASPGVEDRDPLREVLEVGLVASEHRGALLGGDARGLLVLSLVLHPLELANVAKGDGGGVRHRGEERDLRRLKGPRPATRRNSMTPSTFPPAVSGRAAMAAMPRAATDSRTSSSSGCEDASSTTTGLPVRTASRISG